MEWREAAGAAALSIPGDGDKAEKEKGRESLPAQVRTSDHRIEEEWKREGT